MKQIMKKITLMFVLLTILMGGAYAQRFGSNSDINTAKGAVAGAFLLSIFGVGEFINEEYMGGVIFFFYNLIVSAPLTGAGITSIYKEHGYTMFNAGITSYAIAWIIQLIFAGVHLHDVKSNSILVKTTYNEEREGIKRDYFASRTRRFNEFAQSFSVAGTKKGVEVFLTKTL